MTDKTFKFTVSGTTAGGVPFHVGGVVECEFRELFDAVMRRCFMDLTSGKAIFGAPGVGCKGPYEIAEIRLERTNGRQH
jgi:hypothetical protein